MTDLRGKYSYRCSFSERGGFWQIVKIGDYGPDGDELVVWETEYGPLEKDPLYPPKVVRDKFEALIGYKPDAVAEPVVNLVELFCDDEDSVFDQPCVYGNRVDGHAVYCHNEKWLYAPRKCRRTWYTGGETRDEDCEGYKPNPNFKLSA